MPDMRAVPLRTIPAVGPLPSTCRICRHLELARINVELRRGDALKEVAARSEVSVRSLEHHLAHWPQIERERRMVLGNAEASTLQKMQFLLAKADTQIEQIEGTDGANGQVGGGTLIEWVREARATLSDLAELLGEVDRRTQVNVLLLDLRVTEDEARQAVEAWQSAPREVGTLLMRCARVLSDYRLTHAEDYQRAVAQIALDERSGMVQDSVRLVDGEREEGEKA